MARRDWVPERRDIIWIDGNPQAGREMKDVHPLLVLSPREFNARTGIVIGLPMTTAAYNQTNPFAVSFAGPKGVQSSAPLLGEGGTQRYRRSFDAAGSEELTHRTVGLGLTKSLTSKALDG